MMTVTDKKERINTEYLLRQFNTVPDLGTVSVRPAASDDKEFLFRLYCDTRRDEVLGWGFDESAMAQFLELQHRAQSIGYSRSFPQSIHLILEAEGQLMGRILLNHEKSRLHLIDIAIIRAFQNRGIGSAVLTALQSFCRQIPLPIGLSVHLASRAVSLYRRHGFIETGGDDVYLAMEWRPDNA